MINEIDSATLKSRMAAGEDIYLVDIRTPGEVAQGAIPNAVHLPMHLLPLRMYELPRDKDVVLYCRSGARSYLAWRFERAEGCWRHRPTGARNLAFFSGLAYKSELLIFLIF